MYDIDPIHDIKKMLVTNSHELHYSVASKDLVVHTIEVKIPSDPATRDWVPLFLDTSKMEAAKRLEHQISLIAEHVQIYYPAINPTAGEVVKIIGSHPLKFLKKALVLPPANEAIFFIVPSMIDSNKHLYIAHNTLVSKDEFYGALKPLPELLVEFERELILHEHTMLNSTVPVHENEKKETKQLTNSNLVPSSNQYKI